MDTDLLIVGVSIVVNLKKLIGSDMGQKKRDRSAQYALEAANKKLKDTARELMRRTINKTKKNKPEQETGD